MWVRKQDKEALINCDEFELVEGACQLKGKYIIEGKHYILGIYDSKEKALKVLDLIQNRIIKGNRITNVFNGYSMEYTNDYNIENYVFQMPQDKEVK